MRRKTPLEVHWITYPFTGEQGWATVGNESPNDFIYYGPNELERAKYQSYIANKHYGFYEPVKVLERDVTIQVRYIPYQWMEK